MKSLKTTTLLKLDLALQIAIFVSSILCLVLFNSSGWAFIFFYLILGSWQVLSFLLHLDRRSSTSNITKLYGKALMILLFIGLGAYILTFLPIVGYPLFFIFLLFMLLAGPLLAIYYFGLCSEDLKNLTKTLSDEN